MTFKVVGVLSTSSPPSKEGKDIIVKQGGGYFQAFCQSEDEIVSAAADADAVVGVFSARVQTLSVKTIEKLPKLKHIAVMGTGYDGIDIEAATARGVIVTNCPDYALEELANHTMLFILALAKKLLPTIDAVRSGKWDAQGRHAVSTQVLPPLFRLSLQTLGLVGFGNIARAVVPRAKAFGLRIITYSPHVSEEIICAAGVEPVDLNTLLRESDFVAMHTALTEKNRNMMGLQQFRKMKPTAFFINIARGGLVDEKALHTALTEGIIAGAAVDAMDPEPPEPGNPLLRLGNLIVTPHTGQLSEESRSAVGRMAYEEIARVMQGRWPREIAFRNPQVKDKFQTKWGRQVYA